MRVEPKGAKKQCGMRHWRNSVETSFNHGDGESSSGFKGGPSHDSTSRDPTVLRWLSSWYDEPAHCAWCIYRVGRSLPKMEGPRRNFSRQLTRRALSIALSSSMLSPIDHCRRLGWALKTNLSAARSRSRARAR